MVKVSTSVFVVVNVKCVAVQEQLNLMQFVLCLVTPCLIIILHFQYTILAMTLEYWGGGGVFLFLIKFMSFVVNRFPVVIRP